MGRLAGVTAAGLRCIRRGRPSHGISGEISIMTTTDETQQRMLALLKQMSLPELLAVMKFRGYRLEVSDDGHEHRIYRPDGSLAITARKDDEAIDGIWITRLPQNRAQE